MKKILFLLFIFVGIFTASAQKNWQKQGIKAPPPVCYASGKVEKNYTPPPPEFLNRLKSTSEQKSEIIVNYSLFPDTAKQAFEYAVSIWEHIIESPIPIYIQANWRSKDVNVLGSCGPSDFYTNFEEVPHENRYYPVALVEKITKTEITGSANPDMNAEFNKNIDWYYGTDGNTPDSLYDFVSVVLHEIAHGLGFTGFFFLTEDEENGAYGYNYYGEATSFDLFVVKNNNDQLVDTAIYDNPSVELKNALVSSVLYANSPVAIVDGGGYKPRLYAPTTWNDGSSIYHLNDATYPAGNLNSLMTHASGKGEAIHDPGPITNGLMADVGWKHMYIDFNKLKDIEEVKPLSFNVNIKSDYELDTASLFVVFSVDSFLTHVDSLPLLPTSEPNLFTAQLIPSIETGKIHYYINSGDIKNRVFTQPSEAPKDLFAINIGPDHEVPMVEHVPVPYFLLTDEKLSVSVNANDNVGIDTITVEYAINGVPQASFGLTLETAETYSGYFNFDLTQLSDGDIITYNVVAKDVSVAENTKKIPFKDVFTYKIEEIFDPIGGYINNFDNPSADFIISDFDIYTETGFENGALHSPHPYPSPDKDDTYFNFSTILKHPIILQENGTMSFDEVVLVEPGESLSNFGDDDFWDYVIVEGSKDNGKIWLSLFDGYDSGDNTNWRINYNQNIIDQFSIAEGIPEWFISREINLLENGNFSTGDTILIRFRLLSDPYANGWGWVIDNLRVQSPVSSPLPILSPGNITVYPNPFYDNFKVSFQAKNNVNEIQMDVFNIYGQKVKSVQFKNVIGQITEEINLKETANGIYFLTVKENGKQIFSKKIIKNN